MQVNSRTPTESDGQNFILKLPEAAFSFTTTYLATTQAYQELLLQRLSWEIKKKKKIELSPEKKSLSRKTICKR